VKGFSAAGTTVVIPNEVRDLQLLEVARIGEKELSRKRVMRDYFVYIMASRSRNLYTGVTNDLARRVCEHRAGLIAGYTSRYRVTRLVYFEQTPDVRSAIEREKQIKSWRREKKVQLIQAVNPTWKDLSEDWFGTADPSLRSG
jgi:putative endonuclease